MKAAYTVLLLRPAWQHDSQHKSDCIVREHVHADSVPQAIHHAQMLALVDETTLQMDDLTPLAVFEGLHKDLFDPENPTHNPPKETT